MITTSIQLNFDCKSIDAERCSENHALKTLFVRVVQPLNIFPRFQHAVNLVFYYGVDVYGYDGIIYKPHDPRD
jgi:hypothetical protein